MGASETLSRRQRLLRLAESGRLRDHLSYATPCIDDDVVDLIVDVCIRYCEPKRRTFHAPEPRT